MKTTADFLLASASPRRQELLQQIGARFITGPVDIPEQLLPNESPEAYVLRLAREKASAGWQRQPDNARLPALGSDTSVVLDAEVFGKPDDEAHAVEMLMRLSGRSHRVVTGVAMVAGEQCEQVLSETLVHFRDLTEDECRRYWQTGEPADKAGGYGIQGLGAVFVSGIEGSYTNVVGLPLAETAELLAKFGIGVWK